MLTTFSSTFSDKFTGINIGSSVLVGRNSDTYYCIHYQLDSLTNASVHTTTAAITTSSVVCRNLDVYRIKGSGRFCFSLDYDKNIKFPYTGSVLLYIMKYSDGQKTNYNWETVDIKQLPLYTDAADVVYHNHFFNNSNIPRTYTVDISFDVRTKITIKPSQRLRCCLVCFYGHQNTAQNMNIELTTTVFYKGN